ncbi:hypothetical protein KSP40_PGU000388 [Platanthera guangdongensis]|uniref:Uncharacterized protein n=1 Tax=Platanthera guangdongensis TaxID=2320717 RepID=A0ABR2LQ82_9ASPA
MRFRLRYVPPPTLLRQAHNNLVSELFLSAYFLRDVKPHFLQKSVPIATAKSFATVGSLYPAVCASPDISRLHRLDLHYHPHHRASPISSTGSPRPSSLLGITDFIACPCRRCSLYSGDCRREDSAFSVAVNRPRILGSERNVVKNPLAFMSSKVVLLVSHELSLSVSPENLFNVVVCPGKGCIHRSRDSEFEVGRRDFLLPFRSSRIPNDGQVLGEDEIVSLPTMRGLDHTY